MKAAAAIKINSNVLPKLLGAHQELTRIDCNTNIVYSFDDDLCMAVCQTDNMYRSQKGVCVNANIQEENNITNECNAEQGLLAYLVGDTQFGQIKTHCISTDLGIRPDNPNLENRMCSNGGTIDINYLHSFPQISDCICESTAAVITNTETIRAYAVCTNSDLNNILSYNNALRKN